MHCIALRPAPPVPTSLPQLYRVGTFMFGKRNRTLHQFFSCKADSLELPPSGYLESRIARLRVHPSRIEVVPAEIGLRQGYIMCGVLHSLNRALVAFKARYCRPEEVSGGVRRFTDLTRARLTAAEQEIAAMASGTWE